jgi:hypothetical protein
MQELRKLRKIELILVSLLGVIFPIYPTILLCEIRHGNISIWRITLVSLINACLMPFFAVIALRLSVDFDIRQYLDAHYNKEEQQSIIKNYRRYKSKLFQNNPLFTADALITDSNLRKYEKSTFKMMGKLLVGGFCYLMLIALTVYIFAWL